MGAAYSSLGRKFRPVWTKIRTENVGTDLDLSLIVFLKDAC